MRCASYSTRFHLDEALWHAFLYWFMSGLLQSAIWSFSVHDIDTLAWKDQGHNAKSILTLFHIDVAFWNAFLYWCTSRLFVCAVQTFSDNGIDTVAWEDQWNNSRKSICFDTIHHWWGIMAWFEHWFHVLIRICIVNKCYSNVLRAWDWHCTLGGCMRQFAEVYVFRQRFNIDGAI